MSYIVEKYLREACSKSKNNSKMGSKKQIKRMMRYEMDMNNTSTGYLDNNGSSIKIGQRNKGVPGLVDSKPKGPQGKPLSKPGDKKPVTNEGDSKMSVVSYYLQDAIGGDADAFAAADDAVVSRGKNPAMGKGNPLKAYVSDKTGEAIEPNPQKRLYRNRTGEPDSQIRRYRNRDKLGYGASLKGGSAKRVRGGD